MPSLRPLCEGSDRLAEVRRRRQHGSVCGGQCEGHSCFEIHRASALDASRKRTLREPSSQRFPCDRFHFCERLPAVTPPSSRRISAAEISDAAISDLSAANVAELPRLPVDKSDENCSGG